MNICIFQYVTCLVSGKKRNNSFLVIGVHKNDESCVMCDIIKYYNTILFTLYSYDDTAAKYKHNHVRGGHIHFYIYTMGTFSR